jgi:hypothetical protein
MKLLPKSKRVRLIVDGVHMYTTVGQIREGHCDHSEQVAAAQVVLHALEFDRHYAKQNKKLLPSGLLTSNRGYQIQLDIM